MFVPGYNPSAVNSVGGVLTPLKYDIHGLKTCERQIEKEHSYRVRQLFRRMEDGYDFLMCHLHKFDWVQHLYGEKRANYDETKLENYYEQADELAGRIKDIAERNGFDTIIFVSDHGLPIDDGHNEQAFYSCNKRFLKPFPR